MRLWLQKSASRDEITQGRLSARRNDTTAARLAEVGRNLACGREKEMQPRKTELADRRRMWSSGACEKQEEVEEEKRSRRRMKRTRRTRRKPTTRRGRNGRFDGM